MIKEKRKKQNLMSYKIIIKKRAQKALDEIDEPYFSKILNAIENLSEDPRPNCYFKLKGREGFRMRVGNY